MKDYFAKRISMICLSFLLCSITLLAGCTAKEKPLKDSWLTVLEQQSAWTAYQFSGEIEVESSTPFLFPSSELDDEALMVLQALWPSKISWDGVVDQQAGRWEMILKLTPSHSDVTVHFPVMIYDQSIFVQIPLWNKANEYTEIAISELSNTQLDILHSDTVLLQIVQQFVTHMEKSWFKSLDSTETEKLHFQVAIDEQNKLQWLMKLHELTPKLLTELKQAHFISEHQYATWSQKITSSEVKQEALQLSIIEPGGISVMIDQATGTIKYDVELKYKLANDAEATQVRFRYQSVNQSGQQPAFQLDLPQADQIKSFEELKSLFMKDS